MTSRHLSGAVHLVGCLCIVVGCSKTKAAPAKITGAVTYKGAPVTGGTVIFHTNEGVYSGVISAAGKYTVNDVPVGDMVVTIDTEYLNTKIKKEVYTGQTSGSGGPKYPGGAKSSPPPGGGKGKGAGSSPVPEDAPQGDAGAYVKIPANYSDKAKSPLKVNVKDGSQEINLEVKD
jgi:hypothetical protein